MSRLEPVSVCRKSRFVASSIIADSMNFPTIPEFYSTPRMLGKLGGVILSECWQSFIIKTTHECNYDQSPDLYVNNSSFNQRRVGGFQSHLVGKKTCHLIVPKPKKTGKEETPLNAMSRKSMIPGAPSQLRLGNRI